MSIFQIGDAVRYLRVEDNGLSFDINLALHTFGVVQEVNELVHKVKWYYYDGKTNLQANNPNYLIHYEDAAPMIAHLIRIGEIKEDDVFFMERGL